MSEAADGPEGFVPFLVQDNLDLASTTTQQVLEAINQDLGQLLRLPPAQFWHVVLSDPSLHTCLDSFLRFRRRCYDESPQAVQGSSDQLLQLSQRVFRVYWRMAHPQEQQQQNQQPVGAAAASAGTSPRQLPSPAQAAAALYDSWLVDVPKMMDLAVLYGPGSGQLTQQLLHQLLVLQPKYAQDIFNLSTPLTANLHELLGSVKRLGGQLLAPAASAAGQAAATQALLSEMAEAVSFFQDALLTLQALADCLPEAAALLLHPQHHGELLIVLAALYNSTLPLVRRVAQQPAAATVPGLAPPRLQRLQRCLESLVFHLLRGTFCTRAGALAAQAAGADGGGASSSGNSGSSSSSKRPPPGFGGKGKGAANGVAAPGVGRAAAAAAGVVDAEAQGQEMMNLLMLLAHPSDAAVAQQQHGGSGGAAGGSAQQQQGGNLLAAVNHTHHLDVAVAAAVAEGLLALDDAQFDYFLALVDGDRQLLQQRQAMQQQQWSRQGAAAAAAAGSSSSSSGGAAGPAAAAAAAAALPADLLFKVAAIRELLPDYGDGFLAAALHHHGFNTEATINCLLEGSLPEALWGLDPGLKAWQPPSSACGSSSSAAPRRPAAAGAAASSSSSSGLSWTGLASEAAAAAAAPAAAAQRVPLPSLAAAAAAPPRAGVDRRTGRVLGALAGRVRDVTRSIAQEMQYEQDDEYDDEYDDSFDDLRGPGNDGLADIEGDDTGGGARGRGSAAAAGGADEYADEPSGRPPQQQQQPRGRTQAPQQQRRERLWVLDGKVYGYKKEGAQEVAGQAGAQAALRAAEQAALEIHGLGPGGNVPLAAAAAGQQQRGPGGGGGDAGGGRGRGGGGGGPHQDGEGAGGGGRGRGRGRGSYAHKETHKAAVANHHRKDRATQKQARGMF